jgi:hypothetical protein
MHGPTDTTVAANLTPVNSGIVWIGFLFEQVSGPGFFWFCRLNLSTRMEILRPVTASLYVRSFGIDNDFGQAVTDVAPGHRPAWLVVANFDTGTQDLFVNPTDATAAPVRLGDDSYIPGERFQPGVAARV